MGGDGEKQVAAHQQEQAPQESGGCGASWSHPRPPRGSSELHSMRTPGAQGLSHRPRKTSPSSLPGSLDSERSEEVLGLPSGVGAPVHGGGGCLFHPRANLPAQPPGRGSPRGRQSQPGAPPCSPQCFPKAPHCRPGGPEERTPRSCSHTPQAAMLAGSQPSWGRRPRHPLCPARTKQKPPLTNRDLGHHMCPCPPTP